MGPGTYAAELRIDSLEKNDEENEDNNILTESITIAAPPKGYVDLEAVELQGAVTDSNVLFTATVRNNGTAASTNLRADVSCGGESAPLIGCSDTPRRNLEALLPEKPSPLNSHSQTFTGTVPCYSVDPQARRPRPTRPTTFSVLSRDNSRVQFDSSPDIIVLSVEPSVEADGSMKVLTIYNGGNETVSDFKVQMFFNSPKLPVFGVIPVTAVSTSSFVGQQLAPWTR